MEEFKLQLNELRDSGDVDGLRGHIADNPNMYFETIARKGRSWLADLLKDSVTFDGEDVSLQMFTVFAQEWYNVSTIHDKNTLNVALGDDVAPWVVQHRDDVVACAVDAMCKIPC